MEAEAACDIAGLILFFKKKSVCLCVYLDAQLEEIDLTPFISVSCLIHNNFQEKLVVAIVCVRSLSGHPENVLVNELLL